MVTAYCVKDKKKVEIKEPKPFINKRGGKMIKGQCPECGTTVCRMVGGKA